MISLSKFKLNREQQKAVECDENKPYLIRAGAGTGKTRVLTLRILHLHKQKNYDATRILALAFTNKAAQEMQDRLKRELPKVTFPFISTFHAFCLHFLKEEIKVLKSADDFTLIDQDDVESILDMIYDEIEDRDEKLVRTIVPYEDALNAIRFKKRNSENTFNEPIKNTCDYWNLNSWEKDKSNFLIKIIFAKYNKYLKSNNFLDFDDLLLFVRKILVTFPEIKEKWQNRFDYILIDEFQDVDSIQYDIFHALVSKRQHFFVVGDPDQSIYSWLDVGSKASERIIKDFSQLEILSLSKNYRSSPKILEVANTLIKMNVDQQKTRKPLYTDRSDQLDVFYRSFETSKQEANEVANKIDKLRKENPNLKLSDIAVLCRVNKLNNKIAKALRNREINYCDYSGKKKQETYKISAIFRYVKAIIRKDNASIDSVLKRSRLALKDDVLKIIHKFSEENKISLDQTLGRCREITQLESETINWLYTFYEQMHRFKSEVIWTDSISNIVDWITHKKIITVGNETRKQLNFLYKFIAVFKEKNPQATLKDFLNNYPLLNYYEFENNNAVNLMSMHSAKGLEFPYVFLIDLNEKIIPHENVWKIVSEKIEDAIQEERRVLYVGVTRAMNELHLYFCKNPKNNFGKVPSRFIDEIMTKIVNEEE